MVLCEKCFSFQSANHQYEFRRIQSIGSIKLILTLDQIESLHGALTTANDNEQWIET